MEQNKYKILCVFVCIWRICEWCVINKKKILTESSAYEFDWNNAWFCK